MFNGTNSVQVAQHGANLSAAQPKRWGLSERGVKVQLLGLQALASEVAEARELPLREAQRELLRSLRTSKVPIYAEDVPGEYAKPISDAACWWPAVASGAEQLHKAETADIDSFLDWPDANGLPCMSALEAVRRGLHYAGWSVTIALGSGLTREEWAQLPALPAMHGRDGVLFALELLFEGRLKDEDFGDLVARLQRLSVDAAAAEALRSNEPARGPLLPQASGHAAAAWSTSALEAKVAAPQGLSFKTSVKQWRTSSSGRDRWSDEFLNEVIYLNSVHGGRHSMSSIAKAIGTTRGQTLSRQALQDAIAAFNKRNKQAGKAAA